MVVHMVEYTLSLPGERYFLRTLLCTVPSPTSFEALWTVEGVRHPTFQAPAAALGGQ